MGSPSKKSPKDLVDGRGNKKEQQNRVQNSIFNAAHALGAEIRARRERDKSGHDNHCEERHGWASGNEVDGDRHGSGKSGRSSDNGMPSAAE
jgi:hypothetical protein